MKPPDDTHDEVGALIRSAATGVSAPARLRADVEALRAGRRARRRRPRLGFAVAGTAAAALAAVLVLLLGGSGAAGPSLADAATAALRPVAGPAPAAVIGRPALLSTTIDAIAFPAWDGAFGLRATGARRDSLGDRRAVTVEYAGAGGARVGYTIVSTPPLDVPGSARRVTRGTLPLAVWRSDGANVVTWRRAGHTCVLASRSMPASRLLELAAWTGGGAVSGYNR